MESQETSIERFFALHDQQTNLELKLQGASDLTRDLLEQGIASAQSEIEHLSQDSSVIAYLGALADPINRTLAELDELEPAVKLGLIAAEDVEQRRQSITERIQQDKQLRIAVAYCGGLTLAPAGVEVETAEMPPIVAPAAEDTEAIEPLAETSGEKSKPALTITYRSGALRIGKGGKVLQTKTEHPDAPDGLAILEQLIENQGEYINATNLWKTAFGDRIPTQPARHQLRVWLETITYNRHSIIEHNGKRGRGSAYGIFDFDVQLVKESVTRKPSQPAPITIPKATEDVIETSAETSPSKVAFPLSLYESSVVAEFLRIYANELESLGIATINDHVVDNLSKKITTAQHHLAVSQYHDIKEARRVSIKKLENFFKDEDLVLDTAGQMSELDHRYELFSYLFGIEGGDRWKLFAELVDAKRGIIGNTRSGRQGEHLTDVSTVTELMHDGESIRITRPCANKTTTPEVPATPPANKPETITSETTAPSDTNPASPNSTEHTADNDISDDASPEIAPNELEVFEQDFCKTLRQWIGEIKANSLVGKKPQAIQAHYPWFTASVVRNASENGHLGRQDKTLTETDLLMLLSLHSYGQAMSVRTSKTKPNKRLIERLIKEELAQFEDN